MYDPPPFLLRSSFNVASRIHMELFSSIDQSRMSSTLFSSIGQFDGRSISTAVEDPEPLASDKWPSNHQGKVLLPSMSFGPFLIKLAITSSVSVLSYMMLPLMIAF